MDEDIAAYVQTCFKCQGNKPNRLSNRSPLNPIVPPGSCWRTIGVDLIVDLPRTSEGHNAIAVFVDHLSKMVRLVPTTTELSTAGFAKLFFQHVFPHYGMPERIISDRGRQWNSQFFKELCDYADIRLHLSTAYHPQTNGLVERMNEVVETALRHFVAADHRDWNDKLPFVEFALNSSKKDSIGTTPFHMNRVTIPRDPFKTVVSNMAQHYLPKSPTTTWMGMSEPSGHRTIVQAQVDLQFARRCIELAQCRMKQTHDKKGVRYHLYQTGDRVWLSYKHISLRHPSKRHKLVPRFYGPVSVLEMVGQNAVRLDLPRNLKVHSTVPVALVKPYKERVGVSSSPVTIDGNLEFEVEAILNHQLHPGKTPGVDFEVLWKGDFDSTWQDFEDLENSLEIVERYLSSCTQQVRKSILKALTPDQVKRFSPSFQQIVKSTYKKRTRLADPDE